ncbi:MAG: amidase, partial [Actinomycetia bacterium]|nr:amidase [Actinomycetes bacterium]
MTSSADLGASIAELTTAYRRGDLSPVEVTRAHLERIDALEPRLNAFMWVDGEGALVAARASEARWSSGQSAGPLDGVPATVKDIVLMAGHPTRYGTATSPTGADTESAPSVDRLLEAGAVILGKTTTPEFGWKGMTDGPLFGTTRNPWNLDHTPGGSSGGAAAAVAGGIGAVAYGNDGGGSIRIPSSYSGLYGIKPTTGRVPHHPPSGPGDSLGAGGPLARSTADAATVLTVLAQPDRRDWYSLPDDGRDWRLGIEEGVRGLRVAATHTLGGARARPEIVAALEAAVVAFEELGARVEWVGEVFEPLRPRFEDHWKALFGLRLGTVPEE